MGSSDRPGFGIILSLLAIGLVLSSLRSFAQLFQVFMQGEAFEAGIGSLFLDVISFLWVLACLGMLLARRRLFIYLFGGLLLFNLATSVFLVLFVETGLDSQVTGLALGAQLVIAALWLAYLALSQHLREVCCE